MDARLAAIENAVTTLGAKVIGLEEMNLGTEVNNLRAAVKKIVEDWGGRADDIENELMTMAAETKGNFTQFETDKATLLTQLNGEFDKHKTAIGSIIADAQAKFDQLHCSIQDLNGKTAQAFCQVKEAVDKLKSGEIGKGSADSGGKFRGYLPAKSMVPKPFDNQEDKWRNWQEDVADYLDAIQPGMKAFLKAVEMEGGDIDMAWVISQAGSYPPSVTTDGENVWRALKQLTEGEARKVVTGVKCGFAAWSKLHQRFGPSLAAKQGLVLNDMVAMVQKPAKTPAETRNLVTELERRIKQAEDVTGTALDGRHIKSVLAAILDPITRQHTAMYQGSATSYDQLKKVVLEFANNVIPRNDSNAMQVGCVSAKDGDAEDGMHSVDAWDHDLGHTLAAVGASTQCYKCQGYGHLARDCATPKGKGKGGKPVYESGYGKAKGKGWSEAPKGKGKGAVSGKGGPKGKRGPMFGGCWNCGGDHFAAECPNQKGKGKGIKGLYYMEEQWDAQSAEGNYDVKTLSCLKVIAHDEPIKLHNKFADLMGEDEDEEAQKANCLPKHTLAEFLAPRVRQGDRKKARKDRSNPKVAPLSLRPLKTVEPEGLSAVETQPLWECVEMAVDSGASETVMSESFLPSVETKPGSASRRGVQYEVANGVRIPNLGEKSFQGYTEGEGLKRGITAQVCDVNKALLSVHKLVQSGNRVVFDSEGAFIEDKATRERIWLKEQGGMYTLKMWVPTEGF